MKLFIGDIEFDTAKLREDEEHHIIKVLRMNSGDEIYVTDGKGNLIKGELYISGKKAIVNTLKIFPQKKNENRGLHLAIAPTKSIDRFEFFIEKAVELGVSKISPLLCANSERKNINIEKLQKQVQSACKQSLQIIFPEITPLVSFSDFINQSNENLYLTHCYKEFKKIPLKSIFPSQVEVTILVGPEGDFSKKEVEEVYSKKGIGISLGNNRLRTETAGIHIASAYYYSN